MNKYNSIDEVRSAKRRLYFKKEELEAEIKENFTAIKDSFTPSGLFHKLTGIPNNGKPTDEETSHVSASSNPLNGVASAFLGMIVNDLIFKRSSYLKKFISSYLFKMVGPSIINQAGPLIKNLANKAGLFKLFSNHEVEADMHVNKVS